MPRDAQSTWNYWINVHINWWTIMKHTKVLAIQYLDLNPGLWHFSDWDGGLWCKLVARILRGPSSVAFWPKELVIINPKIQSFSLLKKLKRDQSVTSITFIDMFTIKGSYSYTNSRTWFIKKISIGYAKDPLTRPIAYIHIYY